MPTDSAAELGEPHVLDGFPAAAIRFVVALERNRVLIAQEHGLSASELRAMFYIGEVLRVTPKDLADHMEMTTGAITAISGRLVELGLLHRVDHPRDRRSLYLQLTPHGDAIMSKIHEDFREMIAAATSGLTPQQIAEFEYALGSVSERIAGIVGL